MKNSNKIAVIFFIIFLGVIGFLSRGGKENGVVYKIYFLPFNINTYGAISEDNIEQMACYVFDMQSGAIDGAYKAIEENKNEAVSVDRLMQERKNKSMVYEGLINIRAKIVRSTDGKYLYFTKERAIIFDKKIYPTLHALADNASKEIIGYMRKTDPRPKFDSNSASCRKALFDL